MLLQYSIEGFNLPLDITGHWGVFTANLLAINSSMYTNSSNSSVEAYRPTRHITGHFGDDFHWPDEKTDSVKALKETS